MKKKLFLQCLLLQLLLLFHLSSNGQNIAPYVDKNGDFKVFDNGTVHTLEKGEVRDVHIGGDYLIYTDIGGQVKRYCNGKTENLTTDEHTDFFVTQYLTAIVEGEEADILKVRYGDEEELLSLDMGKGTFAIGDSLIAFKDSFGDFSVFYEGEIYDLLKTSDYEAVGNTVAFTDTAGAFHLFHKGEERGVYSGKVKRDIQHYGNYDMILTINLSEENSNRSKDRVKTKRLPLKMLTANDILLKEPNGINHKVLLRNSDIVNNPQRRSFKSTKSKKKEYAKVTCSGFYQWDMGQNLIALVNEEDNLVIIDDQEFITLDYQPKRIKVGYKIISFIDNEQKFYAYWDGKVTELSPRLPKFESLVGNTLIYIDDLGFFHVFDKGRKIALEGYEPLLVAISDGIVVYLDSDGRLKGYYEGRKMQITNQTISNFQLIGRVLIYSNSNGQVKIFHAGERYSG